MRLQTRLLNPNLQLLNLLLVYLINKKPKDLLMINDSLIMKMITTISKGQQITIPSKMRHELGLTIGSKVEIKRKNKSIVIKPIGEDLDKLFREAKNIKPKHNLTPKQMDELNERMFR